MNFMLIRRFFMYLLIFGLSFASFYDSFILFHWLKWVLRRPPLLEQILDNNWLQFCGYESFFC